MKTQKSIPKNQKAPFKVLVLISLEYASWREVLSGILEFSGSRSDWDFRLAAEPGDFLAPQIEEAERIGYDGIILASPGEVDYDRLALSPIPLVVAWGRVDLHVKRDFFSSSSMDPAATGELGARHLLASGRRVCYGFVRGILDRGWPLVRQNAFVETIKAAGRPVEAWPPMQCRMQNAECRMGNTQCEMGNAECRMQNAECAARAEATTLRDWLVSLPKPAAVMADTDRTAAKVVAACHDAGLSIPADVAVLGVDNDAFYALNSRPPLSSVAPPHKEQGYRIAAELDRLMRAKARGATVEGKHVKIASRKVIVRESTRPVGAQEVLARRISEFVKANAAAGSTVADVARHLNCSRRLVEMAFKASRHMTVKDFIADCRLDEVRKRLAVPRATVAQVAAECGFKTAAHLSHLFKRRTGLSIREWRGR